MKVICLMGEPGTGKTTLMKQLMDTLPGKWTKDFEFWKLVPFHANRESRVIVLGKYEEGETFAGTDRMSMAVQPEAIKFMQYAKEHFKETVIVFEGDRLTNQSFLEFCIDNFETSIIYLDVDAKERERRYVERGSNQSEQFIKGRVTKYANLMSNFSIMMAVEKFVHTNETDTYNIVSEIMKKIGI
jgi:uridine kinase